MMAHHEKEQPRTRRTTIEIYTEDRDWLQARQRALSFERNQHVPMFDLMSELISAIVRAEREGN